MTTILITGATGGIGYALAQRYHQRGARLILVGRRDPATLDADFFTPDRYCQADLSRADAAERVTDFLDAQNITAIDILVHNAGLGYYGELTEQPSANVSQLVAVNLRTPVALTHALHPHLLAADSGQVVFISSVAAAAPTADYTVYAATKAALDGFAKNLRIEFGDTITVQLIHPGATRTDMHRKAGVPKNALNTAKYPPPEHVAEKILNAIDSRHGQVTIGWSNKILRWAGTHAARLVDSVMKRSG